MYLYIYLYVFEYLKYTRKKNSENELIDARSIFLLCLKFEEKKPFVWKFVLQFRDAFKHFKLLFIFHFSYSGNDKCVYIKLKSEKLQIKCSCQKIRMNMSDVTESFCVVKFCSFIFPLFSVSFWKFFSSPVLLFSLFFPVSFF